MLQGITQAPIRLRLPLLIVGALMISIIGTSIINYFELKKSVEEHVTYVSTNLSHNTVDNVEVWFEDYTKQVDALSRDLSSREILIQLERVNSTFQGPLLSTLRKDYINNNPFPLGQREQFQPPTIKNAYDAIHTEFHDHFRDITQRLGYYDLFFISTDGSILYSVFKEDDFGTNLLGGRYSTTGLAEVFRGAANTGSGAVSFSDFEPYAPSSGAPASFMAKAVKDTSGKTLGVVAIQLPSEGLTAALRDSRDLGPLDEVYLYAEDGLARSASLEPGLLSVLDPVPDLTHIISAQTKDEAHFEDVIGLRGTHVDAHIEKFDLLGTSWVVVIERDLELALAPLANSVKIAAITVSLGVLLSIVIGYFTARSVTRPLANFSDSMQRMATGDYDTPISTLNRHDEFGQVAVILDEFRVQLMESSDMSDREARKRDEQSHVVEVLSNGLSQLSAGNFSESLDTPFSEEYEELRRNYNASVETMNELMRSIVENSNEIHARAEEISASSDDLSHRTENQAATLEETAAALDELTASVREAADSASEVENVVTDARKDAEESGVIVSEAVDAMSMIRKSSSEISQIIGVIDDIAFQTNLLSLNAGVEAARAGEAGRGFAVVASEVRALAQRSSEAAKQIKSLITSSSEQVETGVGLVGRTGEALNSIIGRVSNIDSLVSGIATGSREQSSGLGEINIGMSQLDQVTQQNAAMVEEATAAAATLRNEAASLTHVVARFKLKGGSNDFVANVDADLDFKPSGMAPIDEWEQDSIADAAPAKKAMNAGGWTDF